MRNIIKVVIVVGSIAAAITGTTVAVKKNKKAAAWYEKFMPSFIKTSCKKTETVAIKASTPVINKAKSVREKMQLAKCLRSMNIMDQAIRVDIRNKVAAKVAVKQ